MNYPEYLASDCLELARLVKAREVSPAELLEIAISRTEEVNPVLNAVVLKHYEFARRVATEPMPQGPLAGVPFLLKDLFADLEGTVTTNGCIFLKNNVAKADSTAVARYRKAGLVIFGKTHNPELGGGPTTENQLWGVTPTLGIWN